MTKIEMLMTLIDRLETCSHKTGTTEPPTIISRLRAVSRQGGDFK
jgi:hypothetical protein